MINHYFDDKYYKAVEYILKYHYQSLDEKVTKIFKILLKDSIDRKMQYSIQGAGYNKRLLDIKINFMDQKIIKQNPLGDIYAYITDIYMNKILIYYRIYYSNGDIHSVYDIRYNDENYVNDILYKYKHIKMLDKKYCSNNTHIQICYNKLYDSVKSLIDFLNEVILMELKEL